MSEFELRYALKHGCNVIDLAKVIDPESDLEFLVDIDHGRLLNLDA